MKFTSVAWMRHLIDKCMSASNLCNNKIKELLCLWCPHVHLCCVLARRWCKSVQNWCRLVRCFCCLSQIQMKTSFSALLMCQRLVFILLCRSNHLSIARNYKWWFQCATDGVQQTTVNKWKIIVKSGVQPDRGCTPCMAAITDTVEYCTDLGSYIHCFLHVDLYTIIII